jgi:hypothetical protein
VKLPSKRELGTWFPIDKDMKGLALNVETSKEKVSKWLKELGDSAGGREGRAHRDAGQGRTCIGVTPSEGVS